MILWAASLVVAVAGYFLLITSNSKEAAIYTAGTANYPKLFAAQSGSTVGGFLIVVGVLGALLALASMAITWRPEGAPVAASAPEAAGPEFAAPAPIASDDEADDADDHSTRQAEAESAPAGAAPVS